MASLVCNTVRGMKNRSTVPDKREPLAVPQAVLFDAYGTLFDVYSVALAAEQLFPGHGQALSLLWRDKQIEYTRLVTTSNHGAHYRPFWELTRAALVFAIKKIAIAPANPGATADFYQLFGPAVERLMNQYRSLSAFPENREVLSKLQRRGRTRVPCPTTCLLPQSSTRARISWRFSDKDLVSATVLGPWPRARSLVPPPLPALDSWTR